MTTYKSESGNLKDKEYLTYWNNIKASSPPSPSGIPKIVDDIIEYLWLPMADLSKFETKKKKKLAIYYGSVF